jgi:hypothetical protein
MNIFRKSNFLQGQKNQGIAGPVEFPQETLNSEP